MGYAYAWDDAVAYAQKPAAFRREYGRENEPFDILLALLEPPSVDLYRRAQDAGITQMMVRPWGAPHPARAGADQFREPIERFAETMMEKCR